MASIYVCTKPCSTIDYSIIDGRVRMLIIRGELLFDEDSCVSVEGWRKRLADFVVEVGLDARKEGYGLPAFIYRMIDDGLLNGGTA